MMHFVGFKNDRVYAALKAFGPPDFWHRRWDRRAQDEIAPGDVAIFADGDEHSPVDPFAFDDSAVTPGEDCGDGEVVRSTERLKLAAGWFTVYTYGDGKKEAFPDNPGWMNPYLRLDPVEHRKGN